MPMTDYYKEVFNIIETLKKNTQRPVCKVKLTEEKCSIYDSKMGGMPYLPKNENIPENEEKQQLFLLAQINFAQMPQLPDFPTTGILQIFINLDELWGADFKNWTNTKGFKVIYHENIDENINENDIKIKLKFRNDEVYPPFMINKEFKMNFVYQIEGISFSDFKYNELFLKLYKEKYPDEEITSFYDLDDEFIEKLWDDETYNGSGTKIGGYPFFTQSDPRDDDEYKDFDILLFQSDSDISLDILWGDCGVANFFIKVKDLKHKNFSNVGYNWDCY